MSASYILATHDPELLRVWGTFVPAGRMVVTLGDAGNLATWPPNLPAVVVLDYKVRDQLSAALEKWPTVLVGDEPGRSLDAGPNGPHIKATLNYAESRTRLADFLPLLEEIAERTSAQELFLEKNRRAERAVTVARAPLGRAESLEHWSFLEGAAQHLGSREKLLDEFRRAARHLFRASSVWFFLREGGGFQSDQGGFSCSANDRLISYLSAYPAVLDGTEWPSPVDPAVELAVRQRLLQWTGRLLAPMHDNGRLHGFVVFGVRDDGRTYDEGDRERVVFFARLVRQFLDRAAEYTRLNQQHERVRAAEKYLPSFVVLGPEEPVPRHVPAAICTLIGDVRRTGSSQRLIPTEAIPWRAHVGSVEETRGIWAVWEDAGAELHQRAQIERAERLTLLRDLALTLNHELGNALVSLTALRYNPGAETNSPILLAAIRRDIGNLETINRHLASLPTFSEVHPEVCDLRLLVQDVAFKAGLNVEGGGPAVSIAVVPRLVEFALESILDSVAENRPQFGKKELSLKLRSAAEADRHAALLTIKGPGLALEGILPAPQAGSIPSHGRIGVFIAKEIIRLHGGEIVAVPAYEGDEISITIREW